MDCILSIDLGTSMIKTALINLSGKVIDKIEKPVISQSPSPYQVEQNPNQWWSIVQHEIISLLKRNNLSSKKSQRYIKAIACCGHSPSMVLVDNKGNPLRPAIIWQDRRAIKEAKFIENKIKEKNLKVNLPSPLTPHSRLPKVLWLLKNEPDIIKRTFFLLEPKDYINYKLTGVCKTSLWSSREFRDIQTGELNNSILNILKIPDYFIPEAVSSEKIIGTTQADIHQDSGLKEGIPVIAGEMDSISSIIGTGISGSYPGFNISGTSDIIGISIPKENLASMKNSSFYRYPFFADTCLLFGVTQSTGQSVVWFNKILQKKTNSIPTKDIIDNNNPLFFLPFLEGARTPHWDPDARGVLFGLNSKHSLKDIRNAIYLGIVFNLFENLQLLLNNHQLEMRKFAIKVSGGGANNHLLNQIKADVLGQTIIQTSVKESGLLGNAILATLGLSVYKYKEAIDKMVHIENTYYPEQGRQQFYQSQLYPIYKSLYLTNKINFKLISSIKNINI
jgi:xylulokinase